MSEYLKVANEISKMADQFSTDTKLSTILRASHSKIIKLAATKGHIMIKNANNKDTNQ